MSRTIPVRVLLAAAVCLPCLTGCFKVTTVLKVHPEGNGTLVETMGLSKEALKQLEAIFSGVAEGMGADAKPTGGFLCEDSFKSKAGSYGPGVKLLGIKKTEDGDWVQTVATYAAKDVNRIRLSENSQPDMPGQDKEKKEEETPYLFKLRKLPEGLAELTITVPQPKPAPAAANDEPAKENAPGAEQPDQQVPPEMLKMFKDLEITVAVECGKEIVETNATYAEGNRVTLAHCAFAKLLENQDKLKELAKLGPAAQDLEALKPLLKGSEGFQFELEPQVVIKFR